MSRKFLITGASGGLGYAIAERFAAAGETLVLQGFSRTKTLSVLKKKYPQATIRIVSCDLTDPASVDSLAETAWTWRRKGLDGVIQAAGVDILSGAARDGNFNQKLEALWQVDVRAAIQLARTLGEKMRSSGGVLLHIGWDAVDFGMGGDSAELFATAKGAITAFSRSLAVTLAPRVRVHVLAPGFIRTLWGENASEIWQERVKNSSLTQRWGTPQDVAQAAWFLASEEALFLNNVVLPINGGRNPSPLF